MTNRRMSHLQLQADSCNPDTARRVKPPLLETADFNDARNPPVRSAPPPVPFRPRCVAVMRHQARPVRIRSLPQRPSGRREATAENRSGSSADHLRRPVSDASGSVCRQTHPTRPTVASQGTSQGAQFTSAALTERVQAAGAQCSMDGRGRCLDNVFIERLWRSLKYEAVYRTSWSTGSRPSG